MNMSGQIKMSPAELQSQASGYGNGAEEIRGVLRRLDSLQSTLRDQWEGKAFNEFDTQFIQLSQKSEEFAHLLEQIQKQLRDTAQAMSDQDAQLSKNFGLF